MPRDDHVDRQQIEKALLDYDEALWRGSVSSKQAAAAGGLDPEGLRDLRALQQCLLDLESLWPRQAGEFPCGVHREALALSDELTHSREAASLPRGGPVDLAELEDAVARSGVISRQDLRLLLSDLPSSHRPECVEQLAYELVQRRIVNGDQAGSLSRGELRTLALGPFFVVEELGRGGMGIVYGAWDQRHNRRVALKMLYGTEGESIARLKSEFRALANLVHPNLVLLDELYSIEGQWFFTMEWIDGVGLSDYVRGYPGLNAFPSTCSAGPGTAGNMMSAIDEPPLCHSSQLDQLRRLFAQLSEGLLAVHAAGKLHRDVKPSNVLVTADERLVLVDYGLVSDVTDPTAGLGLRDVAGTWAYMSPEQMIGQRLTPASDWYSVGVMLYEALAGRRPFDGALPAMLDAKRQGPPELPPQRLDEPASDLIELCVQLLDPDPDCRPSGQSLRHRWGVCQTTALNSFQGLSENQCGEPWYSGAVGSMPRADCRFSLHDQGVLRKKARPFVGRQQELDQLNWAFDGTQAGRSQLVLITGPSGIGKTALVNHFLDRLTAGQDSLVLRGRCHERESVPYKAMDGLVDALCRHLGAMTAMQLSQRLPTSLDCLVRLFPALAQVEAIRDRLHYAAIPDEQREVRRLGIRQLGELLSGLALSRPTILFVDDLQWGDTDSGLLLGDLLDTPDANCLLFLGCSRDEDQPMGSCLQMLWQPSGPADSAAGRQLIHLRPLNAPEGRQLANAVLLEQDGPRDGQVDDLWQESRGNPYFLLELARQLQLEKGFARPTHSGGACELDCILQRRIRGLPRRARELMNVMAVAGQPLPLGDLCRAIQTPPDLRVVALLRSQRLIRTARDRPDEVEIYHDRIRETISGWLTADEKQCYHAQLAMTLEASGTADPEILCVHFDAAGNRRRAAHYGWLAADRAEAALAFDRAARLYRLVLETGCLAGNDELRIRHKLADSLANSGRGGEAAEQYLAISEQRTGIESAELQRLAADQLLHTGHFAEGKQLLEKALELVGMKLPRSPYQAILWILLLRLRIRLWGGRVRHRPGDQISRWQRLQVDTCWSAQTGLGQLDALNGAVFALRHALLARQLGDPSHMALALGTETCFRTMVAGRQTGRDLCEWRRAEDFSSSKQRPFVLGVLKAMRASTETFMGHWRSALAFCDEAEASLRQHSAGTFYESSLVTLNMITCLFFLGRVREMAERIPNILREAYQRNDLFAGVVPRTYFGNLVWLASDQVEEARRQADVALEGWPHQPFLMQHMFELIGSASIDLYVGEGAAAWHRIAKAWGDFRRSWHTRHRFPRILVLHLRARAALASLDCGLDNRMLIRSAQRDAKKIMREPGGWPRPLARLILAGTALTAGRRDAAIHQLEISIDELDAWQMALYSAAAKRRLGTLRGEENGESLRAAGTDFMIDQGIRSPTKITRMLVPACE